MDAQELFALPDELKAVMRAWLHEHDVPQWTFRWEANGDLLEVDYYLPDENGQRYIVHLDGSRHGARYGCTKETCPGDYEGASGHTTVPLRSQPPVPV